MHPTKTDFFTTHLLSPLSLRPSSYFLNNLNTKECQQRSESMILKTLNAQGEQKYSFVFQYQLWFIFERSGTIFNLDLFNLLALDTLYFHLVHPVV